MLEMAEGTVWGSRAVLKVANYVYLCVQYTKRGKDSTVWNEQPQISAYLEQGT